MRSIHKQLIALAIIAPCAASGAMALNDERLNRQLLKLDPQTRLEQTCDTEVMLRINRDRNSFKVDKVIAYAIKDPVVRKYSIKAPGAVFRSRGDWYRLSFDCTTGPRRLDAQSLHYEIGSKIPKSDWRKLNLYD